MSILLAFVAGLIAGSLLFRLRAGRPEPVMATGSGDAPASTAPELAEAAQFGADAKGETTVPDEAGSQHEEAWQAAGETPADAASRDVAALLADLPPLRRLQALVEHLNRVAEASLRPADLMDDPVFAEAVRILASDEVEVDAVAEHARGLNWILASAAFAALRTRHDGQRVATRVLERLHYLHPWPLSYALDYLAHLDAPPPFGAVVLASAEWWSDHPFLNTMLAEHFDVREARGHQVTFGDRLAQTTPEQRAAADGVLVRVNRPAAQTLRDELSRFRRLQVDRDLLAGLGRFVDCAVEGAALVEHPAVLESLTYAESCVLEPPHRSLLVVGEAGVGKTSFIAMLGQRCAARGWTVFESGGADLQAGQKYIGELEQRLRQLTTEIAVDKRVLWHAPDFLQLALSGAHEAQSATILDQMLPAISAGRVLLVSEITPAALNTVLQRRPAIRTALELIRLRPPTERELPPIVRDVATRLAAQARLTVMPEVLEAATYLARHHLGTSQTPGSVIDLLKLSVQRAAARDADSVARADVLATVAQLTGMPQQVLDDRERVDLTALRSFFSGRVIGQDEAVQAVVDRIAMLKAGLTDPDKPVGVFLFAGPTGTGKTELAKTLSLFLFGSADRLIRLDMSEFQTADSVRKIVGDPAVSGGNALTDRVHRQPFSVVLLDEFEKAHASIWDMFLQVFDDGRLTDATGVTVDFRHCIIVLTSNLGSTIRQDAGPGFLAHAAVALSHQHVLKAIHHSFRPEFVNRLDRIIVFNPLGREQMRTIVAKELALVLDRRGLRHREWAVEWEPSALEFLLDRGFSPAMGARPLKRAIDQHLLAPLAATLVEHRFPEGDQFLFVRSDGRTLQVEFVDPDAALPPAPTAGEPSARPQADRAGLNAAPPAAGRTEPIGVSLPRMMLQPGGTAEERAALSATLQQLEARLTDAQWSAQAAQLASRMQRPDFWEVPDRRAILSRLEVMDRVRAAAAGARSLWGRLDRSGSGLGPGRSSRELVARLSAQLFVLAHGIEDATGDAAVEVVLCVDPVFERATTADAAARWCDQVLAMYRKWAARRGMQATVVAGARRLLVVSGFGAARVLGGECGLHIRDEETEHEALRTIARVTVRPTPQELPDSQIDLQAVLAHEVDAALAPSTVIRRYKVGASPVIRDLARGWRTGRAELVFEGNFDVIGEAN